MTAPLTAPETDLQDFPFMPLHVARLRDSDLAAEEVPEACWYAVLLWAASWHQLPAGSLPDNDTVLMRLVGLGRDTKTWKRHRDGALRGFVLCDDGRLYHPVVAEQVAEAWGAKIAQRWRAECARIKKHNQRHSTDLVPPTLEEFTASFGRDVPRDSANVSPGTPPISPPGNGLQETGIGTGTGNNILPFSNENGAALDLEAEFWTTTKAFLRRKSKGDPGALIGKWLRDHGKEMTVAALNAAQLENAFDPKAYIEGYFKRQGSEARKLEPAVPL